MPYTEYDYLAHHGVKGQKWGRRRYQNEDGSYKSGAQGRYDDSDGSKPTGTRSELRRATMTGGLIGRIRYKKSHGDIRDDRIERKQERIANKYNKKIAKSERSDQKIMNARERHRVRLKQKGRDVADFDEGTRYVKAGNKAYSKTISDYSAARQRAAADKSYKKSAEYKAARKAYRTQRANDLYFGKKGTKLQLAAEQARKKKRR